MWFTNFISGLPFTWPWIFALGAVLVSVPIIIHLLNRRRFRRRPWAAMKFLLESLRKNRRRLRFEEMILLLIRCLVLLMLAMAISRFTGCGAMKDLSGGQRVPQTLVILLDDSQSMAQTHGVGTLFSAATADLADQIEALEQGDTAYVLLASRVGQDQAVLDQEGLADRVRRLKPSDSRVNLADAAAAAGDLLAGATGDKVLVIASDFRRADLGAGETDSEAVALRQQFDVLKKQGVKVITLDYGRAVKSNLTVESIEVVGRAAEAKVAIANQPIYLSIAVRNNGPTEASQVQVELTVQLKVGDKFEKLTRSADTKLTIPPGQTARVEQKIKCPQPGSVVITASVPGDELMGDNEAHLALDVRQAVRGLLVDGRLDVGTPRNSETYFLHRALDPKLDRAYGNELRVVGPADLDDVNLKDYDFVVLADVAEFGSGLRALQDYVRGGGGLAIFVGDRVNLDFYNGALYDGGAGLSPYRLGPPKGDAVRRDSFFRLAPQSVRTDGILRSFAGEAATFSSLIRFFAFLPADVDTQPMKRLDDVKPPLVIAKLSDPNQSPVIVSRTFGEGVVVMFYTSASARWTDWPTDPVGTYVVVMNDLRNYLTRPRGQDMAARVGEPLVFELPPGAAEGASESQRRRAQTESARVKLPKTPTDVALVPIFRLESLAQQVDQVAEKLAKVDGDAATKLQGALKGARDAFGRRELPATSASLEAVQTVLDQFAKSSAAKDAPSVAGAIASLRPKLVAAIRGDPAALARRELRYDLVREAGVYEVTLLDAGGKELEKVLYARNLDPAEGDLVLAGGDNGSATPQRRREAIGQAFGLEEFRYENPIGEAQKLEDLQAEPEKEYWVWALSAMLVLMALEIFLAQKFGHYTTSSPARGKAGLAQGPGSPSTR